MEWPKIEFATPRWQANTKPTTPLTGFQGRVRAEIETPPEEDVRGPSTKGDHGDSRPTRRPGDPTSDGERVEELACGVFESLHRASLRNLTKKVLCLVPLATAERVGELQAVSRTVSFVHSDACLSYVPEFVAKTESISNPLPHSFLVTSLMKISTVVTLFVSWETSFMDCRVSPSSVPLVGLPLVPLLGCRHPYLHYYIWLHHCWTHLAAGFVLGFSSRFWLRSYGRLPTFCMSQLF